MMQFLSGSERRIFVTKVNYPLREPYHSQTKLRLKTVVDLQGASVPVQNGDMKLRFPESAIKPRSRS